jgi:hypothetical protein
MDEIANGEVAVDYGVGFVVLHYASPVTSLIFGGWRENQEFQETRYTRDLAAGTPFERVVASDDTSVWELAPLWQERRSWERYLFSNRHNDSQPNYLRDFLSSAV